MSTIRILEPDPNRRGDLFGRLMADLFVALGYEHPRLNIHKSGREIDLTADHRLERRRAIGECKATEDTIGGGDLNKFVGALDVEHDDNVETTGYFISLSGFKETAIEQEKQRKRTKVITLSGEQVISELVKGRIIIPSERATELAGRCCASLHHLKLDGTPELVAHDRGWIWIIYYSAGKECTSFVLVHGDGTPLAAALAQQIVSSDQSIGGSLHALVCLNPPPVASVTSPELQEAALRAYGSYIAEECGFMQLDGLPADSEVGSWRLKLENLFVPLNLDISSKAHQRKTVGSVLTEHSRLAILAAPGGGKSTLIKRLAVAYADPERRTLVGDDLPDKNWLPLFFRCRELRALARASFAELLDALAQHEPVRQHALTFRALADRALVEGRVLLLVDGLDEISDAGDRAAFVCTIRTALQAYPETAIIVTSREAGFRHVAAHLAPVCTYATLSPFDAEDIRRLTVAWHAEVVGDTEKVRKDAEQLALTISQNDRIQRLAINPLLLTTLLLVKRWVGSLPTRRAVLYGKAVEVLLITWNTEGHEPIPEEEALPQLCYVASAMMIGKEERISRPRLASLIQEARNSLPTELGYVKGTVEEFIHRVEDRSSLLMMTGHDVEDGRLVEFFEFRHLTFQEFLTARAMVEGWHPGRCDNDTLVGVLEGHFDEEKWREVIPLAASLGGKATEALINRLTVINSSVSRENRWTAKSNTSFMALGHCLADEAAARPETIRAALSTLAKIGLDERHQSFAPMLLRGRYGKELRDELERAFMDEQDLWASTSTLMHVSWWDILSKDEPPNIPQLAQQFVDKMQSPVKSDRCKGALGCTALLRNANQNALGNTDLCDIGDLSLSLLFSCDSNENYVEGWLLYILGSREAWVPPEKPNALRRMFDLWRYSDIKFLRDMFRDTFTVQKFIARNDGQRLLTVTPDEFESLMKEYDEAKSDFFKIPILIVAYYAGFLTDQEIVDRALELKYESLILEVDQVQKLLSLLGVSDRRTGDTAGLVDGELNESAGN
jgi:hypothetical protein